MSTTDSKKPAELSVEAMESSNLLGQKVSNNGEVSPPPTKHGATDSVFSELPEANQDPYPTSKGIWEKVRDSRPFLVEFPIFLYFLAYKGALTLKEQFIYALITSQFTEDLNHEDGVSPSCALYMDASANLTEKDLELEVLVQESSSELLSVLNLIRNVPALFTTLLICSYTDVVGRKWGIILPCLGGMLKVASFLITAYRGIDSIIFLYIGEVIEGIGGSIMTAQSSSVAYVSDTNAPHKRTFRFTLIQCLHFAGTGIGYLIIGYCISGIGYIGSFWFTLGVYLFCFLWVIFLLPESVAVGKSSSSFSIMDTLRGAIMVFALYGRKSRPHLKRILLLIMLVPVVMDNFILLGRNDVDTLYMLAVPFCWTSIIIGYFQLVKYFCKALVGLAVKPMSRCMQDSTIGGIGGLFGLVGNVYMGLVKNGLELWLVTVVSAPSGLVLPLAQSIMSQCVTQAEQGQLFASLGLVAGASDMFAATVLDLIYSASYDTLPGAVFIIIGGLYGVSMIAFIVTWVLQNVVYPEYSLQDDEMEPSTNSKGTSLVESLPT